MVGTAWPALAARPSRTLVTPLAPPASAPFSIEITTVPTTQACCERKSWLKCTGEGNGNPLQYSCLENSMDQPMWFWQQ